MITKRLEIGNDGEVLLKSKALTRVLESSIEIESTIEKAWELLIDTKGWPSWNSFITEVEGEINEGSKLSIVVRPPGLKIMKFKPTIFEIDKHRKLSWGGKAVYIGYRGVHEFILRELNNNRIQFVQIEKFQGPIVLLMNDMILKTAVGYSNMNEEFKKQLEKT